MRLVSVALVSSILVATTVFRSASAGDVTYYVDRTIGGGIVAGDIVANDTFGNLSLTPGSGIVGYNLEVSSGVPSIGSVDLYADFTAYSGNSFFENQNRGFFITTPTQLLFDFSNGGEPWGGLSYFLGPFVNPYGGGFPPTAVPGSYGFVWSLQGLISAPGFAGEYLTYYYPGGGVALNQLAPESGIQVIGTTTPILPSPPSPPSRCLPVPVSGPFRPAAICYTFLGGPSGGWFDPASASGYEYQMTGNSLFTDILGFPAGFAGPFDVMSSGCTIPGTFAPGDSLDFVALCGHGVSAFTITGIIPSFDPTDLQAFPIQLAFSTPTADFEAEPLGSAIAEPSGVFLLSGALLGLAVLRRQRPEPQVPSTQK